MRRKFNEAEVEAPIECREAISLIAELYAVEKRANTGPPEERARLREQESRPIVKRIQQWALGVRALPGSGLRGAVEYLGGMWDSGLLRFLDDPNVPIDNNGTERCLRGVVIGRKNHYGSRLQRGTEVAALLCGLIESAKLAGVGLHTYLRAATRSATLGRGGAAAPPHVASWIGAYVGVGRAVKPGLSEVLPLGAWLVGLAARALQLNRHLQANTERQRDVLSSFFIGRELLRRLDDLPRPVIDPALHAATPYPQLRRHQFVGILQNGLLTSLTTVMLSGRCLGMDDRAYLGRIPARCCKPDCTEDYKPR